MLYPMQENYSKKFSAHLESSLDNPSTKIFDGIP